MAQTMSFITPSFFTKVLQCYNFLISAAHSPNTTQIKSCPTILLKKVMISLIILLFMWIEGCCQVMIADLSLFFKYSFFDPSDSEVDGEIL